MNLKLLSLLFILVIQIGCQQDTPSKEVLFVCTHGAARSPIAAAYFNKLAAENQLNYHAIFKGTEPDKILLEKAALGLSNDHFDVTDWKPSRVLAADIAKAYKVVTFDCILPEHEVASLNLEQWDGIPSISKDYERARNAIKGKVEQLITSLKK